MQLRNFILAAFTVLGFAFLVASCTQDEGTLINKTFTDEDYEIIAQHLNIPNDRTEYLNIALPKHMESSGFSVAGGTITNKGAILGRVLFYDTRLSKNDAVSCASCHEQANGFAENAAFSKGFDNQETKRNSLAIGNVRFYYHDRGFMWDERAESVEDQTRKTVTDHIEMGMDSWADVTDKVADSDFYPILFKSAFGDENITEDRIQVALSMFVRSIISKDAPFDRAMVADNNGNGFGVPNSLGDFTDSENRGMALYMNSCRACHGNIVFLGKSSANNGLDMEYADKGVGELSNNSYDNGVFKVPFMRNIGLTAPYMHDGRFQTLEEVIEHYSSGIKNHNNLDALLPAGGFDFSAQEKEDLVAFLHTLSDEVMATEERYSNPFK